MGRFAPAAHLGSIVNDWAPYCTKAVRDVLEQRWTTGLAWWGMREGAVQVLAPGQIGDDAFLRRMNFYVKGVEGRVPS